MEQTQQIRYYHPVLLFEIILTTPNTPLPYPALPLVKDPAVLLAGKGEGLARLPLRGTRAGRVGVN